MVALLSIGLAEFAEDFWRNAVVYAVHEMEQFLDTVLSLVPLAARNLLRAVLEMLVKSRARSRLCAPLAQSRENIFRLFRLGFLPLRLALLL